MTTDPQPPSAAAAGSAFDWDDYDPDEGMSVDDPDWCPECGGEGRVPTADYESYFGTMYKSCPKCHGDDNYYGPLS